jgi:uncharacterized protein YukE
MDDVLKYNPAGIADYTASLNGFSGELDNIEAMAQNRLAGIAEFFDTDHASMAYTDAQMLINQGIAEGKEVILRHGGAVDAASTEFISQDAASAQTFMV